MSLTTRPQQSSTNGIRPVPGGTARAAAWLSWLVAALALVASVAGLVIEGVYAGPASTAEMFRAYDVVTAVIVAPGLVMATYLNRRGSVIAGLVAASLQAAVVYTYAYYLFGTGFNDLFLLHLAVFAVSVSGLVLSLATLDQASIASRFGPRTPVRTVAALLGLLTAALGGMWVYFAIDNATTGEVPAGSRLVETDTVVHLGMTLDLTLLVPLYAVAAVLLWRRHRWGLVLAAVALFAGLVHQAGYLVAMPFQVASDIPDAVAYDPGEPLVVLVYGVAAALLLSGARDRPSFSGQSTAREDIN